MARFRFGRDRRRGRLSLRFFAVFMAALSIPLLGGAAFFVSRVQSIEEDVLEANARTLGLFRDIIDSTSSRLDHALLNLRQDSSLQPVMFMGYPLDLSRVTAIADAHRSSVIGTVSDPYLVDIFAYFSSPRILFTQNEIYLNTQSFYPTFYTEPGVSHDEWLLRFAPPLFFGPEVVRRDIVYRGASYSVLELRYSLPPVPRIRSRGVVAALIDRDAIARLIQEELIPHGGVAAIVAADGTPVVEASTDGFEDAVGPILAAVNPAGDSGVRYLRWRGEDIAVAFERSPSTDWTILSAVPRNIFLAQLQRVVTIFVIAGGTVLLCGIPLSLLLAYRTTRPLLAISDVLRGGVVLATERKTGWNGGALATLTESVYELTQRHAVLRQLLDEQKPFVRQVIVDRLLRGAFLSEHELLATLRHYEVDAPTASYGVFYVFLDGYYDEANDEVVHEFIVKSTLVLEQLQALLPEGSLVHGLSLTRLGIVVDLGEDDGQEVAARLTRVLNSRDDVRCTVVAGPPVERLFDVPESLRRAMATARTVLGEDEEPGGRGRKTVSYYYPADLESRLVALAEAGRTQELDGLLASIEAENIERRQLTARMLKALTSELEGTRNKILASIESPPPADLGAAASGTSVRDHLQRQLEGIRALARYVSERDGRRHKYKRAILEFMDTHFAEPGMGLKRLALEFSLSEVYLSQLFRQMTGTTFSAYLERLRIDEAAELLRSTALTVNEVAHQVGYSGATVFRRAFKRRFGVSPSAFIDSIGTFPSGRRGS